MIRSFPLPVVAILFLSACSGSSDDAQSSNAADTQDAAASVRVVRVGEQPVQSWVYAQGTARAAKREFLSFQSTGRVTYIAPGLDVGSRVRRGQLIARQEPNRAQAERASAQAGVAGATSDRSVARASLREAQAQLELAQETFQRYRILLRQNSASEQEYDEAEARLAQARAGRDKARAQLGAVQSQVNSARAQLGAANVTVSETRIVSPINGQIARINIEEGLYFSPQVVQTQSESTALRTVPVVIIDASSYEIIVDIPSFSASQLAVGADVLIRPSDGAPANRQNEARAGSAPPIPVGDFEIRGRISAISPSLDPESRTFQAKVRTTAGSDRLQDGAFVAVWVRGAERQQALAVPFDAIRYRENRPFLFVVDPKTRQVTEREVTLGMSGSDNRVVTSGLRRGELVVTDGKGQISNGDRVRVIGGQAQVGTAK